MVGVGKIIAPVKEKLSIGGGNTQISKLISESRVSETVGYYEINGQKPQRESKRSSVSEIRGSSLNMGTDMLIKPSHQKNSSGTSAFLGAAAAIRSGLDRLDKSGVVSASGRGSIISPDLGIGNINVQQPRLDVGNIQQPNLDMGLIRQPGLAQTPKMNFGYKYPADLVQIQTPRVPAVDISVPPLDIPPVSLIMPPPALNYPFGGLGGGGGGGAGYGRSGFEFPESLPLGDFLTNPFGGAGLDFAGLGDAYIGGFGSGKIRLKKKQPRKSKKR
jgi:hypothetical protein